MSCKDYPFVEKDKEKNIAQSGAIQNRQRQPLTRQKLSLCFFYKEVDPMGQSDFYIELALNRIKITIMPVISAPLLYFETLKRPSVTIAIKQYHGNNFGVIQKQ